MARLSRLLAAVALGAAAAAPARGAGYDEEPIRYSTAPVDDPVARLAKRLVKAALPRDARHGYLPAVLKALDVPVSSQVLVFSKTSLQRDRIGPRTPRALYFNDDVYVGFVPGGEVLEIASVDPRQGTIFYVVPQKDEAGARFERQTHECLHCHDSTGMTGGVPGLMVRSVLPDRTGQPILSAGSFVIDQRSPFEERWGGWYVTGKHGPLRHMGNVTAVDGKLDREAGANVTTLAERFEADAYPTGGSDLVALMVLEHQAQLHNLLTKAHYEARLSARDDAAINEALGRPRELASPTTERRLGAAAEEIVKYMLFTGEAPLGTAVAGTSGFAEAFAARGPRDRRGRSLRELDLRRRLFKYPLSYLVYSEQFDALPPPVLHRVAKRLGEVLAGKSNDATFAHLSAADRRVIREILVDTKPRLAAALSR